MKFDVTPIKKSFDGGYKASRGQKIEEIGRGYKTSKEEAKTLRERNKQIIEEHERKILAKYGL